MAKKTENQEVLKVTLIRSVIGRPPKLEASMAY